jgi:hypothetical protein
MTRRKQLEQLEPYGTSGTGATTRALPASMIRQIFAEPFIPNQIDLLQRCRMSLIAERGFKQRDDAQVNLGEMRIGAKMIAQNHHTLGFQLAERLIHLGLANMKSPQPSQYFRGKSRLLAAAAANFDDGVPGAG